ncbi:hypothetical protein ZWY2020_051622 [Hordeum vulgare]|nr:hypothetical protein ZWY2020_051622 [Hordeum vulgare]
MSPSSRSQETQPRPSLPASTALRIDGSGRWRCSTTCTSCGSGAGCGGPSTWRRTTTGTACACPASAARTTRCGRCSTWRARWRAPRAGPSSSSAAPTAATSSPRTQANTGPGHGVQASQQPRPHPNTPRCMLWQAIRREPSFIIRNAGGRYLRANGKYLRWRTAATVAGDDGSAMMQWDVQAVPLRLDRPTLIDPPPQLMRRRRRPPTEEDVSRQIRYIRAGVDGDIDETGWRTVRISTNSLMQLRLTLANLLGQNRSALHTTLCVRAGAYADLSPLLIDLPIGNDRLDIVVITHGTPVDNSLLYPNVNARN